MTKILDRQLIFSYIKSYIVCLFSLMSLFIIVDLFTNLESFWANHEGFKSFFSYICTYYASKVPLSESSAPSSLRSY